MLCVSHLVSAYSIVSATPPARSAVRLATSLSRSWTGESVVGSWRYLLRPPWRHSWRAECIAADLR